MATNAPVKPLHQQANGTEVKALTNGQANGKEVKEGTAGEQPPPPVPPVQKEKQVLELPPLDERIHRLNILFDLQKQLTACQKSLNKLMEFKQEGDQDTISFHLEDNNRNEFNTSNQKLNRAVLNFTQDWAKNRNERNS